MPLRAYSIAKSWLASPAYWALGIQGACTHAHTTPPAHALPLSLPRHPNMSATTRLCRCSYVASNT